MIELAANASGHKLTLTLQRIVEVGLDSFPDEAVIAHLKDRGYAVDGVRKAPLVIREKVYVGSEDGEADPTELHVIPGELIERAEQLVLLWRRGEAWDLIVSELVHQNAKL